ncbi:MAG: GGDEF domain-containing protein [Lachnospiraceae bacterium]
MNSIPIFMMLVGELVLAYCIYYCGKLGQKVKYLLKESGTSTCVITVYLGLIIFFSIGYMVTILLLKRGRFPMEIMVGMLLLFGSIFVLFSLLLLQFLFKMLMTIRLNQTDPATGLLNKTAGMNYIKSKLEKETGDWALYIVDLDEFKKINDTYGHMTGDQVINGVAGSLRNSVDGEDLVFRFGGDEFVVFTQIDSKEEMIEKGKRIHDSIPLTEVHVAGKRIKVEGSLGAVLGRYPDTAEELFERADQAMYHAKRERECKCYFVE